MGSLPELWTSVRASDLPDTRWPRHEIIDGSLHVTPIPTVLHQEVVQLLFAELHKTLDPDRYTVRQGVAMVCTDGPVEQELWLQPDVSAFRAGSRPAAGGAAYRPEDFALVAEIASPTTSRYDRLLKLDAYRGLGVPHYWVVDQATGAVDVLLGDPADEGLAAAAARSYPAPF